MVEATLNWTGISGLLIFLAGISCFPLIRMKKNKKEFISRLDSDLLFIVQIALMVSGFIFFFQGWRLDPIIKIILPLSALAIYLELLTNYISESTLVKEPKNLRTRGIDPR